MSRLRTLAKAAILAAIVAVAVLALTRSERPVLFRFHTGAGAVRPRAYCVLNPFRERGPERAAEAVLELMREGKPEVVAPFVAASRRDHILARETQYRVLSWRLCRRTDDSEGTALGYWVRRKGYAGEEEVFFDVLNSRGWEVTSYNAIY